MQIKFVSLPAQPRSPLRKLLALVVTIVLAIVALMFSAVLLAVVLAFAVFGGIYLWWKTRTLRKLMREVASAHAMRRDAFARDTSEGEVVEGEVIRVDGSRATARR